MKEILEKIKAVLNNWHGHVDPQAAIQSLMLEFMTQVEAEIDAMKQGVDADAAEFVRHEMKKAGEAVTSLVLGVESRLQALENAILPKMVPAKPAEPEGQPAQDKPAAPADKQPE